MKVLLLVPKVVQGFIERFPEVRNNAYKYFNYDNRVVEERVPRGDAVCAYKGPDELSDADFDQLIKFAKTLINPLLQKYSPRVACEDALHQAIRSFGNGMFDGKVNSNRYAVLMNAMGPEFGIQGIPYKYGADKKKKEKEPKEQTLSPGKVHYLGLKGIPQVSKINPALSKALKKKKIPVIVKEKGKFRVKA